MRYCWYIKTITGHTPHFTLHAPRSAPHTLPGVGGRGRQPFNKSTTHHSFLGFLIPLVTPPGASQIACRTRLPVVAIPRVSWLTSRCAVGRCSLRGPSSKPHVWALPCQSSIVCYTIALENYGKLYGIPPKTQRFIYPNPPNGLEQHWCGNHPQWPVSWKHLLDQLLGCEANSPAVPCSAPQCPAAQKPRNAAEFRKRKNLQTKHRWMELVS